ncbi:hypothetical protein AB0B45_30155 [Nonomuraea sp. NPDC049152]|uniref:hypothetical protein n=1 Tax=Nonomuraea sp. NPDC049152 TaxID=3154350 RepID=UPI0033C507B4
MRLFRPVAAVLAVWSVVAVVMLASGADPGTVNAPAKLVWSPLWFLLGFAALTAATPPTLAAVTFGLAQCGAALLLLDPLRRPGARAAHRPRRLRLA